MCCWCNSPEKTRGKYPVGKLKLFYYFIIYLFYFAFISHPIIFFFLRWHCLPCLLGGNGRAWLIANHELHKSVQCLILTKLLLVIKLSQATLWLMAAGFWWGCRCLTGTTVRLRPSVWFQACVCFAGKIPSNKTPPPVFLPPCQPNRDKNAQHSHRHKHTKTNWSWIHTAPKLTIMCPLFHVSYKKYISISWWWLVNAVLTCTRRCKVGLLE